jgi:hypothetical protein
MRTAARPDSVPTNEKPSRAQAADINRSRNARHGKAQNIWAQNIRAQSV